MDSNSQPTFDLRQYVKDLQQQLRVAAPAGPERWRPLIEKGLAEAYRTRDIVALCDIAQAIVSILDVLGRQREAISEIDHAISLGQGAPDGLAMLLSMKATFQTTSEGIAAARATIREAEEILPSVTIPFARSKLIVNCRVVKLVALDRWSSMLPELSLGDEEAMNASDRLFLLSYFIPAGFARGRAGEMRTWIRMLRIEATGLNHPWRVADASLFQAAEQAISEPFADIDCEQLSPFNWGAGWRVGVLRFRAALLRRDPSACQDALQKLVHVRRRAGDARLDTSAAFEGLYVASFGSNLPGAVPCEPPSDVHLFNLPSLVAGGQAVALAGTRAAAGDWLDFFKTSIPEDVVTSLEWPVSLARVQGLLQLRCGDVNGARKQLERAVEVAARSNSPIELAFARLQLAEVLRQSTPAMERQAAELRQKATEALRAAGIDGAAAAYEAAHIHPLGRNSHAIPNLTDRELEVLVALSQGLTYKAAAEQLGVKWTTVQTIAHRCYDKLERSGRSAACARAEELGLL